MPKVNPFTFARPIERRDTFTFVDPRYPDSPVSVTFRSPDAVDFSVIQAKSAEFQDFYRDKPFPAVDGKIVQVNPTLAESVAAIYVLQEGAEEDKYTMEELVAFMVTMPTIFADMSRSIAKLTEESDLGKLIGVHLSHGLSLGGSEDTPSSTSG